MSSPSDLESFIAGGLQGWFSTSADLRQRRAINEENQAYVDKLLGTLGADPAVGFEAKKSSPAPSQAPAEPAPKEKKVGGAAAWAAYSTSPEFVDDVVRPNSAVTANPALMMWLQSYGK